MTAHRPSHREKPASARAVPTVDAGEPAYVLDRRSVRAVDRAAVEEYGIPGIVLMENAARALAAEALSMLGTAAAGGLVLVICGPGNNGGDGWALARHLHNEGVRPVVVVLGEPKEGSDAAINCAACRAMRIEEIGPERLDEHRGADLVVDAIFGTGLDRPPAGRAVDVIEWVNACGRPVLAVDVPSGLDADTGRPLGTAVRATRTVSFVGLKSGFLTPGAGTYVGDVVIGDIGAPRELTTRFGRLLAPGPAAPHRR